MIPQPAHASASLFAKALIATLLFLLSADLLFVLVAGYKIKYAYFLVLCAWLPQPRQMAVVVVTALRRVPRFVFLPLLPLAISVATSASIKDSLAWMGWLGFDAFTAATLYAFLKVRQFSKDDLRTSAEWALAGITLFALVQLVSIYGFHRIIFSPQTHFAVQRINGLSGWPHFMNIFSFLLLPLVLVQRRLSWAVRALLVVLMFALVESTAKTGWVLFVAFGILLFCFDRQVFTRHYLLFLAPVTAIALAIPLPSYTPGEAELSAAEKVVRFSRDLDVTQSATSGTDRVLIARMGLAVWAKHPWFGVGPRSYNSYVFTRFDRELPGVNKLDASHSVNAKNENIWIELLAECGALFTLAAVAVLVYALWVPRWHFANRLELGAWIALVLYFVLSGQVSQNGLLTMVYAVFGIYLYARELGTSERMTALLDHPTIRPPFSFDSSTSSHRVGP